MLLYLHVESYCLLLIIDITTTTMTESTYESTQTTVQSTVASSQSTEPSPTTTGGSESTTKGKKKTLVFACIVYKAFYFSID